MPTNARPVPYAADVRAKGWRFELDLERARQSDTWTLAKDEGRPWLLMLWAVAWEQTPCGSYPNDDDLIAARIGMPEKTFARLRKVLMRGWWLAEDGRLYHDVIVERVQAMLGVKDKERARKAAYRARMEEMSHGTDAGQPRDNHGTPMGLTRDSQGTDEVSPQGRTGSATGSVPPESHGSDPGRDATGTRTGTGTSNTEDPPGADAPAPPKGDAVLESEKRAPEPAEPEPAPSPPAAPAEAPAASPGPVPEPAKPQSMFAAAATKARATAKQSARDFDPPNWVPIGTWGRWLDYRESKTGGYTNWEFTVSEMREVIRTLEKAMANKGTTAGAELDATMARGLRKPEYFSGPDVPPLPPGEPVLPVRPNRRSPAMHRPGDVSVPVWDQWVEFRRRKKAPVTDLVLAEVRAEAETAGLTLDAYLTKWLANGTTSFQAGYIKSAGAAVPSGTPRRMTQHEINAQRGAAFREPLAPKLFGEHYEAHSGHVEDVEFRESAGPESDPYKGF